MATKIISSITTGPRETNIELLRILSMFLVLVVHADFWSLGAPQIDDFFKAPVSAAFRVLFESLSIVCVNVFILISGWFTIRVSKKGFLNFAFQCGYFLIGTYVILLLTGQTSLTMGGIAGCFCLTTANWFIKAYIGLYILSPVLNLFVEKASKTQLASIICCFYLFQTIFGMTGATAFIAHGYSTFSFIGLYLLAGFIKRYMTITPRHGAIIYIVCVLCNILLYPVSLKTPIDIFTYENPIVVLGSVGLFMLFKGIHVSHSSVLNYIAKSSFAVFLLHTNPNIGIPVFIPLCKYIFDSYSGAQYLLTIFFTLTLIFVCAIALDYPRRLIWKRLSHSERI